MAVASVPVLEVCRAVIAATASDAGVQLALKWANFRYKEFTRRARSLFQTKHFGNVYVPAPLTAGTVAVTQGSNLVVGTGTAFTSAQAGWSFRANIVWFIVTAVNVGTQTLTLDASFSESTNAAAGYYLVQRYIPIAPEARFVSAVAHPRYRRRLRNLTWDQMNTRYPSRQSVGGFPRSWTEAARQAGNVDISALLGSTGQKLIEVYPPSTTPENYQYAYWNYPYDLNTSTILPPEMDADILSEGVLVDAWRYKSEQAATAGKIDLAGLYNNKSLQQMTIWDKKIQEAINSDASFHPIISVELDMWEYYDDQWNGNGPHWPGYEGEFFG